ncbi:hypothetical protein I302_100924 [Kwoniella bestiolae CBS 10118]|uniref:Ribosome biogenesis protein UTP30 n=1 Tax=Kwoniella bestiolae CBS 10118 TaxID=1296100 RepID=A0A1B9G6F6_9TREE|nr:ribosome biogenesis protein UTP30 [Kwoniella bestiolae CBS 10118]OCF26615.1 ribosome biogenesis protein UTP30 [Kwoniella bestiolae CBS 10118]
MPPPIKLFSSVPSSSKPKKLPVEPLPSSFSEPQAKKAVDALLKHHEKVSAQKEEEELLPKEENVWLVVNTKRGSTRKGAMPVRIQLPHPPLPPPPTTSICLLSKSPQREYKDLLSNKNIKFISRVVGVEKLKGKFKPFEPRRELMRDHEIFLCDERVLTLMPGLLGKMFFEAKKQPIPVNLNRKDLKAELGRAIASTYFHPSTGTSYSIRIATPSSSSPSQILENLLASIPSVISNIPEGWSNVLSVGIKTNTSVMLPIWNAKLEGRFDKSAAQNGKDVEMEVEVPEEPVAANKKSEKEKEKKKVSAPVEEKREKKKSSTIGSANVARKAKGEVIGTPKVKKTVKKGVKA